MPEPRKIVAEGRLDHVVDVGDLPLQVCALADVALEGKVVHLKHTQKKRVL